MGLIYSAIWLLVPLLQWLTQPPLLALLDRGNDVLGFLTHGLLFLGLLVAVSQRQWLRAVLFSWWFGGYTFLYSLDITFDYWPFMDRADYAIPRLTVARVIILGAVLLLLGEALFPRLRRWVPRWEASC